MSAPFVPFVPIVPAVQPGPPALADDDDWPEWADGPDLNGVLEQDWDDLDGVDVLALALNGSPLESFVSTFH